MPGTGEVVNLADELQTGRALRDLTDYLVALGEIKAVLESALIERSRTLGTKTIHLRDAGLKVEISSGTKTIYDAEAIEDELREAGMPDDQIREVVKETVSHTVDALRAKSAAAANPEYRAIIEANTQKVERKQSVSVKRS